MVTSSPHQNTKPTCWIITEGIAGTENQCLGVAEALGLEPEVKRVTLNEPWRSLSPYLGLECASTFSEPLSPPWPDLLIASGRKSIAASRYIKRKSGGRCFTVQIQDPRISPRHFDLVAVPAHDPARGENVIVTTAAPNRITAERLDIARGQFTHLCALASPRVALLIGGNSKAYRMDKANIQKLCDQITELRKHRNFGLMITASRRTGDDNRALLEAELGNLPDCFFWDGSGENPYFGFLAYADIILVTADSASMLSEAASTGKPVYRIDLEGGAKRIDLLHSNLENCGAVRPFEGQLESWSYEPLNDAGKIAQEIRKRLDRHW